MAREENARLTFTTLALAVVLFLSVALAASILLAMPEALEALSAPAFGAPWMTAPAPETHRTVCAAT